MDGNSGGEGRGRWLGQVGLLVCSGIISFVVALSTAVLIPVVAERFDGGVVEPLRPSAYCVARGLGPFDSDALVLAMEWRNARAEAVQVRQPYLILGSLGDHRASDRVDPLNEHRFVLVGTYPNLNAAEFSYPYDRQTSFALETESISSRVLIFRPENYWDEEDPRGESDFRFRSARDWSVRVGYQYSERGELVEPESVVYLFDIDVYPSVGGIRSGAGLQADCWDFARGDG